MGQMFWEVLDAFDIVQIRGLANALFSECD